MEQLVMNREACERLIVLGNGKRDGSRTCPVLCPRVRANDEQQAVALRV